MESFRTFDDIRVELLDSIARPYEVAVASARTCYSGKGLVYVDDVSKDEKAIALRDKIAGSTREAGHLTTRQHAHFVFGLSGVSRQFLWGFLHSHPFYNSEQVSQRYVRVKRDAFLRPPLPEAARPVYEAAAVRQMEAYERLIGALREPLSADFFQRFPARAKQPDKWKTGIDKRAYEVARYALGVGTTAYLYHTVSALTLLRYHKLCQAFDVPAEQAVVVKKMIDAVRATDPLFDKELEDPIPLESTPEFRAMERFRGLAKTAKFREAFDRKLEGRVSKLTSWSHDAESVLADGVRTTLGLTEDELSTADAVALVTDPKENPLAGNALNPGMMERLAQALHHVHFTFHKKISHAADSQDQRHRTVLANRPVLGLHFDGTPDYVTPFGVTQSPLAEEIYRESMEASFRAVSELLTMGVEEQYAFYLLPNAFPIRLVTTGDLAALQHKWKLRLCYNAQEEIFRATVDEVKQVREKFPRLGEHFRAPCYQRLRAGTKPYCPEGDRFCGVPVWKWAPEQYVRKSL